MYSIYRFFMEGGNELIAEGLTLKEAKEHCSDPNSSSHTCASSLDHIAEEFGPWFDGYESEE